MKIYVLRHELRDMSDPTFLTPLLPEGLSRTKTSLKESLNSLDIDVIYSSPFIRALQTIHPYVSENNKKINIEYAICETIDEPLFKEKPDITLNNDQLKFYNVDLLYNSLWNKSTLKYKERKSQMKYRTKMFIQYLKNKYENTDTKILLSTHMWPSNLLLNALGAKRDIEDEYGMGKISTVDENNTVIFLN
tara:strand:- start:7 stop:579 length:573 start_codon:yes stop_codon:yes gene_type:complete